MEPLILLTTQKSRKIVFFNKNQIFEELRIFINKKQKF